VAGIQTDLRLTRRERQAETRLQVISAARRLFLERGYHGTTLSAVVDAAGFTKGAVYSNFASKAELALAVVEEIERGNVELLAQAFGANPLPADRAGALTVWAEELLRDTDAIRLRNELNFAAMDDPELAETMRHKSRNAQASIAVMLRGLDGSDRFLMDVDDLASALLALAIGVGLQRLNDPEYDLATFVKTAGVLTGTAPDPPVARKQ
jgi:AcrR family transcriptional regulator